MHSLGPPPLIATWTLLHHIKLPNHPLPTVTHCQCFYKDSFSLHSSLFTSSLLILQCLQNEPSNSIVLLLLKRSRLLLHLLDEALLKANDSEPLSPSKVTHPATKVDMCALLSSLSPMKKKHFVGELVDEHKSIRLVGFDPAQKMKLDAFNLKKTPVLLKNCDIQLNQYSKSLEVVIKGYTQIAESTTKFDINDPSTIGTQSIVLDKLQTMKEYDKVNVQVKVIDINSPQLVGAGKTKQEVTIADQSGTATLTLWENDIDTLTLSNCYILYEEVAGSSVS